MSRHLFALATSALLTLLALPAFAQDGKPGGESVVVLEFETFNAEQEVMDHFYKTLHDSIESHPEMQVKAGGDVSINDLILTLGCESATAECLKGLSEFVEGDRIVFGSVQHSENVYLLTLKMFDFSEGNFIREVTDETIEGDAAQIKQGIGAVVEGFLYGDVGTLEVNVTGHQAPPEVFFDGEKLGRAPLTIEGLPLGEHVVTLRTAQGTKKSKKVMLHRGSTSRLQFNLEGVDEAANEEPVAIQSEYVMPGWIAASAGVAGLAVGIIGTTQVNEYDTEASGLVCGDALCPAASTERANKLQDDMDSAYTMSIVGYSVAAVGLSVGSYFLYQAYAGGSAETASSDAAPEATEVSFGVGPTRDGFGASFELDF